MRTVKIKFHPDKPDNGLGEVADGAHIEAGTPYKQVMKQLDGLLRQHKLQLVVGLLDGSDDVVVAVERKA
jgi:hypothetical protein